MTTITRTTVDKHATAEASGWGEQHEAAETFVRNFRKSNPDEWPLIKAITIGAHVGTGTAWRALKRVKESTGKA